MKGKLTALAGALLVSSAVSAGELSYNYAQLSLLSVDFDGEDAGGAGLSLSASPSEGFFVTVNVSSVESDDEYQLFAGGPIDEVTVTQQSIGIGGYMPLNERSDFIVHYQRVNAEVEYAGMDADGDANVFSAGVRGMINDQVELNGGLSYIDGEEDNETSPTVGARVYFNEQFSIGANYTTEDDVDTLAASFRLNF